MNKSTPPPSPPKPMLDIRFNEGGLPAVLAALGATYTCSSVRYYWNGTQFVSAAINTYHDSINPQNGLPGYFSELSSSLGTRWSCDFSNVLWVKSAGITRANATSCFSGQVASKLTAAANTDNVTQVGATSTNAAQTSACYVEQGTAATTKVTVYNGTTLADVSDATITWATGVVTSSSGTNFSLLMLGVGPNGGALYKLASIASGVTSGNIRSFRIFPDSSGGGGYVYLHHATCLVGSALTMCPIVSGSGVTARGTTNLSFLLAALAEYHDLRGCSIVADVSIPFQVVANRVCVQMSGATPATSKYILSISGGGVWSAYMYTPTNFIKASDAGDSPTNQRYIQGASYRSYMTTTARNGRICGTINIPGETTSSVTSVQIGNTDANTTQFTGYIHRVRLYKYLEPKLLAKASLK